MKNAEYTFKQPMSNPSKKQQGEEDKPEKTIDKGKQRQLNQLNRDKEQLDKKFDRFKKTLARKIAAKFLSAQPVQTGYDPNSDPMYLWGQVEGELGKIRNICERNKTQINQKKQDKDGLTELYLYKVILRKKNDLTTDIFVDMGKNKRLSYATWENDGICVYVWASYIDPTKTNQEEAPEPRP